MQVNFESVLHSARNLLRDFQKNRASEKKKGEAPPAERIDVRIRELSSNVRGLQDKISRNQMEIEAIRRVQERLNAGDLDEKKLAEVIEKTRYEGEEILSDLRGRSDEELRSGLSGRLATLSRETDGIIRDISRLSVMTENIVSAAPGEYEGRNLAGFLEAVEQNVVALQAAGRDLLASRVGDLLG